VLFLTPGHVLRVNASQWPGLLRLLRLTGPPVAAHTLCGLGTLPLFPFRVRVGF
jgi:hypothetical protein